MDSVRFGQFVAQCRREADLTQRQLGERVGVTDKAVSKWERGLSLPDVALLEPLAGQLGVSVAELLQGARRECPAPEVEEAVESALALSQRELARRRRQRRALLLASGLLLLACPLPGRFVLPHLCGPLPPGAPLLLPAGKLERGGHQPVGEALSRPLGLCHGAG